MAARRNRPSNPSARASAQKSAPAKPQSDDTTDTSGLASQRIILSILGGFATVSLLYLIISWPGYQTEHRTQLAERALNEERYADAIPHLEYIVKRFPAAWVRITQLGDCALELGRPKEALEYYERSLAVAPKQELFARRGRAHYLINPNSAEAIDLLQKAYDKDPNDPETNYYMGLFYMNQGQYAKAAGRFQAAAGDPKIYAKAKPALERIRRELLGG